MIRIITLNLNGIRSASRKGWLDWAAAQGADAICVQEVKAQHDDLEEGMRVLATADGPMRGHFHFAEKKGYSGVGVYARKRPRTVVTGFGDAEFDAEGRYVEADFGHYAVVSLYLPSGSSSEERQQAKFRFLDVIYPHLAALKGEREFILVGDVNIAHKEIDLKNWRSNQKNSGFLPEERAWMTRLLAEAGLVDVYRTLHPETTAEAYTWWSNRGQAWANNVGWRLDYHLATPALAAHARTAAIHKASRFSDHAPLTIDYDFKL